MIGEGIVDLVARVIHDLDEDHDFFVPWESDSEWSREEDRKMAAAIIQALEKAGYFLMHRTTPEEDTPALL